MARYRLALGWLYVLLLPMLVAAQAPPNTDQYGDPLPPGALARLGTVRWRHEAAISFAAFLPGGKSVVSVSIDQTIHIWEFPSGKPIHRIALATGDTPPGFRRPVLYYKPSAVLSTDGKVIATFFGDSDQPRIRLHDVQSGKELRSLEAENLDVKKLFFSTNHERLVSLDFDGLVRVWDWANGKELHKFLAPGGGNRAIRINAEEDSLILSPDGNTLMHMGLASFQNAVGPRSMRDTNALRFIDVNSGKEISPVGGDTVSLVAIHFTADSKQLVTQADDSSTRRWEAATGKELSAVKLPTDLPKGPIRQTRNVIVSPDGQIIATVSRPMDASLNLIAADSGKNLSTLALAARGPAPLITLLFGPGNKQLVVNHLVSPLGVMAKDGNGPAIELFDVATGKLLQTFTVPLDASKKGNLAAARKSQMMLFSPNGKTLAWSVDGKTMSLWDTVSGHNTSSFTLPGDVTMEGVSFTPDGRCLALEMNGGGAMLFELAAGAPRRHYGKLGHSKVTGPVPLIGVGGGFGVMSIKPNPSSHIAVSPNGKALALTGPDKVLRVWDIATGTELAAFQNAAGKLTAVTFSPDNKTLASTCADTTGLVWDLAHVNLPPATAPTRNVDVEECWQALADNDGDKAFRAICDMSAMPKETLAFFKDRLQPAPKLDLKRAQELIALLDHDQYKVREKAIKEPVNMGEQTVPALDKALAGNPTLESRLRLQEIRGRMAARPLKGDRLRYFRAVEVLERIGTPQSRHVLQALATGEPGVLLTISAREALEALRP